MGEKIDGMTDKRAHRREDGWIMDRWIDRQIDAQRNRQTDRQTDGMVLDLLQTLDSMSLPNYVSIFCIDLYL